MTGSNKTQKTALITGGTHGIGKATAELLVKHGWKVTICASNRSDCRGHEMERELTGLRFRLADVTDESAIKSLVAEIMREDGRLDLAFNNAGIGCKAMPPHEADIETARRIIETNLLGTMLCIKHEISAMLTQEVGGVIINNASVAAFKASTGADSSYSASKAGIAALTREAAANRYYREKIRFYTLVPGFIETRMSASDDKTAWVEKLPSARAGTPSEVANAVLSLAESEAFGSGQLVYLDGGDFLI